MLRRRCPGLDAPSGASGAVATLPSLRLLAVVPAYNEADTVARVVQELRAHAPQFDVVVIDDGSKDATAGRAEAAGATVIRLSVNLGIGGAVQTGLMYAVERGYDYVAQVDGDGQHDPRELAKLLGAIRSDPTLDLVSGSRFLTEDYRYPAPISRRTGIHVFAFALTRIVGQPISDPTSGFRLLGPRAIARFVEDYPTDYPEVEALMLAHASGLRLAEVPVRMRVRGGGRSSINAGRSLYYMVKVSLALLAGMLRRRIAGTSEGEVVSSPPANDQDATAPPSPPRPASH